jgi:hypothetical protein
LGNMKWAAPLGFPKLGRIFLHMFWSFQVGEYTRGHALTFSPVGTGGGNREKTCPGRKNPRFLRNHSQLSIII